MEEWDGFSQLSLMGEGSGEGSPGCVWGGEGVPGAESLKLTKQ